MFLFIFLVVPNNENEEQNVAENSENQQQSHLVIDAPIEVEMKIEP
jgi:hypothetical protein